MKTIVSVLLLFASLLCAAQSTSRRSQAYETHSGVCSGAPTAGTATGPGSFGSTPASGACTSAFGGGFGQALGLPSGTLKNLVCTSGHVGVSASDGVATVFLGSNGVYSATALTCTIGTSFTCSDTTHAVSATAGQLVSVQVVPASGTTGLINISCSVGFQQ